eukprot:1376958-Amorphochlora_amoeboformis.AAC.1
MVRLVVVMRVVMGVCSLVGMGVWFHDCGMLRVVGYEVDRVWGCTWGWDGCDVGELLDPFAKIFELLPFDHGFELIFDPALELAFALALELALELPSLGFGLFNFDWDVFWGWGCDFGCMGSEL